MFPVRQLTLHGVRDGGEFVYDLPCTKRVVGPIEIKFENRVCCRIHFIYKKTINKNHRHIFYQMICTVFLATGFMIDFLLLTIPEFTLVFGFDSRSAISEESISWKQCYERLLFSREWIFCMYFICDLSHDTPKILTVLQGFGCVVCITKLACLAGILLSLYLAYILITELIVSC